ncbi:hypothetical protein RclHR1_00110026 [Rhizophagus clarus]|uniref:Uncharacterized protein n=1 Tax=Rhizophagus clarus TaxID=94130 RepID=A0A2Z6Q315_9GLOM|nr:hypothetical protein RclHR1_00110026 [Rhizophagus clarus]
MSSHQNNPLNTPTNNGVGRNFNNRQQINMRRRFISRLHHQRCSCSQLNNSTNNQDMLNRIILKNDSDGIFFFDYRSVGFVAIFFFLCKICKLCKILSD